MHRLHYNSHMRHWMRGAHSIFTHRYLHIHTSRKASGPEANLAKAATPSIQSKPSKSSVTYMPCCTARPKLLNTTGTVPCPAMSHVYTASSVGQLQGCCSHHTVQQSNRLKCTLSQTNFLQHQLYRTKQLLWAGAGQHAGNEWLTTMPMHKRWAYTYAQCDIASLAYDQATYLLCQK